MKILSIVIAVLLLIVSSSQQESPELKEASDLTESVVKLFNARKYAEALPLAKRALEIRQRLLPRDDARIGTSLSNLGDVYIAKHDYDAARETFQRLLQFQTERLGPDDAALGPTLDRLSVLYFRQGDDGKAEATYQRALALKEKEFGTDNLQVAHTVFGLAQVYRARNDYDRSASLYTRALMIYGRLSGAKSPEFERTREAFRCLVHETANKDGSEDLQKIVSRFEPPELSPRPLEMLTGKALKLPKPSYPIALREQRVSAKVVVKVKIDEEGKVIEASDMCQGHPLLSESAVKAARGARFTPTLLDGKPTKVDGTIVYKFVHNGPPVGRIR